MACELCSEDGIEEVCERKRKKQEDEEVMTGLELDEIQVGQAVFFILGFAAGFPLSAREAYVRNKVLCFGKALSFWISTFNICCFAAGLEKAGVQKRGGEVSDGPSRRGGISLLPRASSLFVPVPLS